MIDRREEEEDEKMIEARRREKRAQRGVRRRGKGIQAGLFGGGVGVIFGGRIKVKIVPLV
jgi:hypothetical protein